MRIGLGLGACVAALYWLTGRGHAFGAASDEAYLVRLALSLCSGAYALPGAFGGPITDPLPGYPALIAPFVAVLAPHWERLWFLGLAAVLACAWLSWRLARRLLKPGPAAAAGLLVALSPALVAQSGCVLPDAAFTALAVGAFLGLDGENGRAGSYALLAALGALAALVRPYGALLPAALALGLGLKRGPRAAAFLLTVSLVPLAACLARNASVAGVATAYARNWSSQAAGAGIGDFAAHALAVAAAVLGGGALGLTRWPEIPAALAGLALAAAAAFGARRLSRCPRRPVVVALAAFTAALLGTHLTWRFALPRYALPLLAPLWIFAAAAVESAGPALKKIGVATAFAVGALSVFADWGLARDGLARPLPQFSRLGAWARVNLPAEARLESFSCQAVALQSGRDVECAVGWDPREAWLVHLQDAGIGWVHELGGWRPDGFMPPGVPLFVAQSQVWLRDPADFELVFDDPVEGRVFRLKPRDAGLDRKAWELFQEARSALAAGDQKRGRDLLEEAVRLRPRFAYAWALQASLENDPRKAFVLLRRAAAGDPGAARVAAALDALPHQPLPDLRR